MSGGVLRAIRHELGLPLYYGMDDMDYQLLTRREVRVVARVGFFACLLAYVPWIRWGWR